MNKTEIFIEKARKVHGDKYNYDKVKYTKSCEKVIITCPIHGDFLQIANNHLQEKGCPVCYQTKFSNNNIKTQICHKSNFILKCNKKHNNKYNYDKTDYIDCRTKVIITCPIHGDFLQSPRGHLLGHGCSRCTFEARVKKQFLNKTEFIERAKNIHDDKYNYDKVDYKHNKQKIIITCDKHGDFLQRASNHLSGQGCPKCGSNNISIAETEWLDYLNVPKENRNKNILTYNVDALIDKTVYEFNGDYWHGNPKLFNKKDINRNNKHTFGYLYKQTLKKKKILESHGYKVIDIWEDDWKKMRNEKLKTIEIHNTFFE